MRGRGAVADFPSVVVQTVLVGGATCHVDDISNGNKLVF